MTRPKLTIQAEPIDRLIEIIGVIGLIILIGLPIMYFNILPDTIPIHFNFNGTADGFSGKGMIWLLPIMGFFMYWALFWINKYPHTFNYPQKITLQNAERQYKIATRMIRILSTMVTCVFAYITYCSIQTALDQQNGLGAYFMPIFLLLMFFIMGYFVYQAMKKEPIRVVN